MLQYNRDNGLLCAPRNADLLRDPFRLTGIPAPQQKEEVAPLDGTDYVGCERSTWRK